MISLKFSLDLWEIDKLQKYSMQVHFMVPIKRNLPTMGTLKISVQFAAKSVVILYFKLVVGISILSRNIQYKYSPLITELPHFRGFEVDSPHGDKSNFHRVEGPCRT